MIKIKKIAMQLCLSSAVLAEMPAFAAEAVQSGAQLCDDCEQAEVH